MTGRGGEAGRGVPAHRLVRRKQQPHRVGSGDDREPALGQRDVEGTGVAEQLARVAEDQATGREVRFLSASLFMRRSPFVWPSLVIDPTSPGATSTRRAYDAAAGS